jgi:hypothetical protein
VVERGRIARIVSPTGQQVSSDAPAKQQ